MNSKVLLLLLGALYITGCARAYTLTLEDAKTVINAGWHLFTSPQLKLVNEAGMKVKLHDDESVEVNCKWIGLRCDCGIPQKYILPAKKFHSLNGWMQDQHPLYYVRKPELKKKGRNAGLIYANTSLVKENKNIRRFNFHVQVTKGKYYLLKKLLFREQ